MRSIPTLILSVSAIGLAACVPTEGPNPMTGPTLEAEAVALDATGQERADIRLTQLDTGVRLVVEGRGLSPGVHGVHVHEFGQCAPPTFESAGGHWNPLGRQHGRDNPAGQHLGDVPNLIVGANGTGLLEAMMTGAQLTGGDNPMLNGDGAAVVVHLYPDDYRTDPAGASGQRVACGVVTLVDPED